MLGRDGPRLWGIRFPRCAAEGPLSDLSSIARLRSGPSLPPARDAFGKTPGPEARGLDESPEGSGPGSGHRQGPPPPAAAGRESDPMSERPASATYRLQAEYSFHLPRLPWVSSTICTTLGISHVYASPLMAGAVRQPSRLRRWSNPRPAESRGSGRRTTFRAFSDALKTRGHGDCCWTIVPNHMCATDAGKPVVAGRGSRGGAKSPYAKYFDIDFSSGEGRPERKEDPAFPILGDQFGKSAGRTRGGSRCANGDGGLFQVRYGTQTLPLAPGGAGKPGSSKPALVGLARAGVSPGEHSGAAAAWEDLLPAASAISAKAPLLKRKERRQ